MRDSLCIATIVSCLVVVGCQQPESKSDPESGASDAAGSRDGSAHVSLFTGEPRYYIAPGAFGVFFDASHIGSLGVNPEKPRGSSVQLFRSVAPAVVAVRAPNAHGTGFVIDNGRRIVTNHHVVDNTFSDPETSHSYVEIHTGTLVDGRMILAKDAVRAWLLAADPVSDLAVLEFDSPQKVGSLKLASRSASPGDGCAMVGHPSLGLLWTLRTCEVAGLGKSPGDLVDLVMMVLAAEGTQKQALEEAVESMDTREMVLSSCGANPGDSGGPLVNESGEVIAVTHAIPADPAKQKFTYHVALTELKAFLETAGDSRTLIVPDVWRIAGNVDVAPGQLVVRIDETTTQYLLDLDRDTPMPLIQEKDFRALLGEQRFDAEFAMQVLADGSLAAFYDTDGDGAMDRIFLNENDDEAVERGFRIASSGEWVVETELPESLFGPDLLDPSMSDELDRYWALYRELLRAR